MSYVSADTIVAKLTGVRKSGQGWIAQCPAHDDQHASFKVSPGRKGTVVYCHAGCTMDEIVFALGIKREQLFYDYEQRQHGVRDDFEVNAALRALVEKHTPYQPSDTIYRLDDVMWEALVTETSTTKVPLVDWVEAMCKAGVSYPDLMAADYAEAMTYQVVVEHGPLTEFLLPMWEAMGRPDLTKLRKHAFVAMSKVYAERGGVRDRWVADLADA